MVAAPLIFPGLQKRNLLKYGIFRIFARILQKSAATRKFNINQLTIDF